jgi:SNF2 family DNA or RNA helicase
MTMNTELFMQSPKPWLPLPYMKKGAKFLLEHAVAALFLDPGLGKTSIVLAALKILFKKKMINKVLIVAPLRVCFSVWPNEIKKWADFNHFTYEILHGPDKDEALKRDAQIYIINPEGLEWLGQVTKTKKTSPKTGKTTVVVNMDTKRFKALEFDVLVIDELTRFKHPSSDRYKVLKLMHKFFGRRWGLTGSPAANGLMDLFGQCYILDEGRTFGPYITHFKNQYFEQAPNSRFVWYPKHGAPEQIYKRLSPLALRMSAEDYLVMPQKIDNNIIMDLPDDAREIYDSLEEDLIVRLEEGVIVAANAAVASGKCRQVASGGLYLDPTVTAMGFERLKKSKREWVEIHDEKTKALASLVEELQGSPLLVAYDFQHDLERIKKEFGKDVPYIGGGVSTKRSTELEKLWNQGKLPLLLGQPQSMAHGLNLQEVGNHVAWYSLTWDFELYDQLIRRVLRQGNKHSHVTNHHLIMRDTIDEVQMAALRSKNRGQQALFLALKELAKRRRPKNN